MIAIKLARKHPFAVAILSVVAVLIVRAFWVIGDDEEKWKGKFFTPSLSAAPGQVVDLHDLCFPQSVLPDTFEVSQELVLADGHKVEPSDLGLGSALNAGSPFELERLYEHWGRTAVVAKTFSVPGTGLGVRCVVELFESDQGASQAFQGTGFMTRPREEPEVGTFSEVAGMSVGDQTRYYLSLHAVIQAAESIFRSGNALCRLTVYGESTASDPRFRGDGLTRTAASLALVLEKHVRSTSRR